jgi:hypothetical protein
MDIKKEKLLRKNRVGVKSFTTFLHRSHEITSIMSAGFLKYKAAMEEVSRATLRKNCSFR